MNHNQIVQCLTTIVFLFAFTHLVGKHMQEILGVVTGPEATKAYRDESHVPARVEIYNALAAYETILGASETDTTIKSQYWASALQHVNMSTSLDSSSSQTWVVKGLFSLVQKQYDTAESHFATALKTDAHNENTFARLGKAVCSFVRGAYAECVRLLRAALNINPALGADVRYALGVAHFFANNMVLAKRAFERTIELQPNHAKAMVALATILYNNAVDAEKAIVGEVDTKASQNQFKGSLMPPSHPLEAATPEVLELLQLAYSIDPTCSSLLIHLSNHFLYRGEYDRALNFAKRAMENIVHAKITIPLNAPGSASPFQTGAAQSAIRAEVLLNVARTYHALGDLERAWSSYTDAYNESKGPQCTHPLILFGYAQACIARNNWEEARRCLEVVHSAHPNELETTRLLGAVCSHLGDIKNASKYLNLVVSSQATTDTSLITECALACQRAGDLDSAYTHFKRAILLSTTTIKGEADEMKDDEPAHPSAKKKSVPFQLLHNMGVLCHQLKKSDEAESYYNQALATLQVEITDDATTPSANDYAATVTTRYNLALLTEQSNRSANQEEIDALYDSISTAFPSYIDAYLRRGSLAASRGDVENAAKFFNQAIQHAGSSADPSSKQTTAMQLIEARTLLGNLYIQKGEFTLADKEYQRILASQDSKHSKEKEGTAGDAYAKLALGNISLLLAIDRIRKESEELNNPNQKSKSSSKSSKKDDNTSVGALLRRAALWYRSVLNRDPHNVYAAHGLATVLATQGRRMEAKDIFLAVRTAKPDMLETVSNVAHIYVQQEQYGLALRAYEDVRDRLLAEFYPDSHDTNTNTDDKQGKQLIVSSNSENRTPQERLVEVYMCLARTHFLSGAMIEAISFMDKALELNPKSALIWYDRALAQEEYAVNVLQRPVSERRLDTVTEAIINLQSALLTFKSLHTATKQAKHGNKSKRTAADLNAAMKDEEEAAGKDEEKDQNVEMTNAPSNTNGVEPISSDKNGSTKQNEEEDKKSTDTTSSTTTGSKYLSWDDLIKSVKVNLPEDVDLETARFALSEKTKAHSTFVRSTLKVAEPYYAAAVTKDIEDQRVAAETLRLHEERAAAERARLKAAEAAREAEKERIEQIARQKQEENERDREERTAAAAQGADQEDENANLSETERRPKKRTKSSGGRKAKRRKVEESSEAESEEEREKRPKGKGKKGKRRIRRLEEHPDSNADEDEIDAFDNNPASSTTPAETDADADADADVDAEAATNAEGDADVEGGAGADEDADADADVNGVAAGDGDAEDTEMKDNDDYVKA